MNTSRARMCTGKIRHRTRNCALRAIDSIAAAHADLTLHAYFCNYCNSWHVGHPKPSEQKRLRFRRLLDLIGRANHEGDDPCPENHQ